MIAFYSPAFLFIFIPVLLVFYFVFARRFRYMVLLAFSFIFYIWCSQYYVFVLILLFVMNYLFALIIKGPGAGISGFKRRGVLIIAICFNLLLLIVFKYSHFMVNSLVMYTGLKDLQAIDISRLAGFQLPLGISFITFMTISYVIDIYRGKAEPSYNPINFAFYLSFFPKVGSGPLDRYTDIIRQNVRKPVDIDQVIDGIKRFVIGLGKKVLIANTISTLTDQIFIIPIANLSAATAWLGVICFTVQLYFDFAGYTDMAIGLGKIFGFRLMENFNYPYISTSIREFWRRWHISLSIWLRDYLYIPLGGNRISQSRTNLNLLIVFLVCGFWHGAALTFILWGLWHGLFLVLERTKFGSFIETAWKPAKHVYALLVIMTGWVFFRSGSISYALGYVGCMFTFSNPPDPANILGYLNLAILLALVAGICGSIPVIPWISKCKHSIESRLPSKRVSNTFTLVYSMIVVVAILSIFVISMISMAGESFKPFLYSQF